MLARFFERSWGQKRDRLSTIDAYEKLLGVEPCTAALSAGSMSFRDATEREASLAPTGGSCCSR